MHLKTTFAFALFVIGFLSPSFGQTLIEDKLVAKDKVIDAELAERILNMPNIEVGRGITFQPKDESYKLTLRFRMQNLASFDFDDEFSLESSQAQVKRLRLRFDGYIFSPKLVYSIQLGFSPYDTRVLPNENMNIVRDAMIYYVPGAEWNIGFGQTKIRANRARLNSSSALQFVDRSIVNSEFNLDRDFGIFGEYHKKLFGDFNISGKGSVTLGEGRNFGASEKSGFAYTGRLELFPFGRLADLAEGDFERTQTPKVLLAGAYGYNDRALRKQGSNGSLLPNDERRSLQSYFIDFIFKYQGFAFYTDYMGRICDKPLFDSSPTNYIYTGNGLNLQTSYLFPSNWEIALRHSTLNPSIEVKDLVGYKTNNQATLGVTKYLIGHNLKIQADASYNYKTETVSSDYSRWQLRFQIELGL